MCIKYYLNNKAFQIYDVGSFFLKKIILDFSIITLTELGEAENGRKERRREGSNIQINEREMKLRD